MTLNIIKKLKFRNQYWRSRFVGLIFILPAPFFIGSFFEQWDSTDAGEQQDDKDWQDQSNPLPAL
jgi:hypothetical protein